MLQTKKRFWGKKPGFDMGDVLHIAVNVLFVAVIYATIELWSLVPLAIVLVLLSKWRVLAVQPRFWLPNIRANLVDLVVGVSTVIVIHQTANASFGVLFALLYLGWLLFLKPQTQDFWVALQALWAQFFGIAALFMVMSIVRQPLVLCVLVWLVSWAAARHFFSNYEEPHYRTLGLVWGFLMCQLVWVQLHWIQFYILGELKVATTALVAAILSASIGSIYHAYKKGTLQRGVLLENFLFAGVLLVVVLTFSRWSAGL